MANAPLARDKFKRPKELPEKAAGFLVFRVPSGRGGAPVPVQCDGFQFEIPLDMGEEEFADKVGKPGRYRLDAADENGEAIKPQASYWVDVKTSASAEPPPASSAMEAANVELVRAVSDALKIVADNNRELASANARAVAGRRPGDLIAAAAGEDEDVSRLRQVFDSFMSQGGEEKELSPEEEAKRAAKVKIYVDTFMDVVTTHGGKAWGFFKMLQAQAQANKPAPALNGTSS